MVPLKRLSVLVLHAPSNGQHPFSYHTKMAGLSCFVPFLKIGINDNSDSQIDKPQRGCPKISELLDVNINTGVQSKNFWQWCHCLERKLWYNSFEV